MSDPVVIVSCPGCAFELAMSQTTAEAWPDQYCGECLIPLEPLDLENE